LRRFRNLAALRAEAVPAQPRLPRRAERLASPCNIWAKALGDVKTLRKVTAGTKIKVGAAG